MWWCSVRGGAASWCSPQAVGLSHSPHWEPRNSATSVAGVDSGQREPQEPIPLIVYVVYSHSQYMYLGSLASHAPSQGKEGSGHIATIELFQRRNVGVTNQTS